jgi:hypothetical protein
MLRSLWLAAALSWVSLSSVAMGQGSDGPTPAQIRAAADAFDLGREAYQRRDFVNAAEQFERADSQAPSSTAIEYAIRSREKAHQLDRAATLAALGRERHPDDANLKKLIPPVLERAARELFELALSCSEPCELAVSGKIVHGAPSTARILYLVEGAHTIRAGFGADRSASRDVQATRGGRDSLRVEAPPVPEVEPAPPPAPMPAAPAESPPAPVEEKSRGWSPTVFWVGAGLTAAASAATIWSGVDTLNNPGEDRVQRECEDESCALYQDGLRSQRRTNILVGVTAGLGVGTVLIGLLATDWGGTSGDPEAALGERAPRRKAARAGIEPWLALGDSQFIGARGRF